MGSPLATYSAISGSDILTNATCVTSASVRSKSAASRAHPGDDLVRASRQQAQHARGVVGVRRLFEQMLVDHDDRISAQHDCIGMSRQHGSCLIARQPLRVVDRSFAGKRLFVNVSGIDLERNAGIAQKFGATRRGGGENEWAHCGEL